MTTDEQPSGAGAGTVLVLFGSKAGVGTSAIAANLAIALHALANSRVLLIEAHYDLGNQGSLLDLAPERHLRHALAESLADGLVRHSSGVEVLLRAPEGDTPTPAQLRTLLRQARALARYTVVDSASRYDELFHTLLEDADLLLMLTTPETTALRHGERFLQQAEQWGVAPRVRVVINRWESESSVEPSQLQALFGDRIIGRLPSAGRLAVEAANAGQPFVVESREHPLSQAVAALAAWVHAQPAAERRPH